MRIGVDVGGTNTDAVILSGQRVVRRVKQATTPDVGLGIEQAITALLHQQGVEAGAIDAVMIGTTHFTNAFVQAHDLSRVAALRIGFPASRSIPPFTAWPDRLKQAVGGPVALVAGGFQFDGRPLSALDVAGVQAFAGQVQAAGIGEIAISSVFAQVNDADEQRAAELLDAAIPGVSITLSSAVGRTGLIERENAAIMNASLRPLARRVGQSFGAALARLGIEAPFFVSRNDGTLMHARMMEQFPVLTFAAGPTNSLRGAFLLSGRADAIVVDIGGTTADFGALVQGYPRQSAVHVDIGGIRTNFRTPDILSIGLGGGSRVRVQDGRVGIGPDSVGFRLAQDALVFGGQTLTATDLAVAAGHANVGNRQNVAALDPLMVAQGMAAIHRMVADGIDRMKTNALDVPLILVGGGAVLIDGALPGISDVIRPTNGDVANAVGAAIGQVSGEVDRISNFDAGGREQALADARGLATDAAVRAGADPATVTVVELEDLPLQYLPGGARRVICRVVGDLAELGGAPHA